MSEYSVDFQDGLPGRWFMGIHQVFPDTPGLDSVIWKLASAHQGGENSVEWNLTYDVVLGQHKQVEGIGIIKPVQKLPANAGTAWRILNDGDPYLEKDTQTSPPSAETILITNRSGKIADAGIGVDGDPAAYKRNVENNVSEQFQVNPIYYVTLYTDAARGDIISSARGIGPFRLKLNNNQTRAIIRAHQEGQSIRIDIAYPQTQVVEPVLLMPEAVFNRLLKLEQAQRQLHIGEGVAMGTSAQFAEPVLTN